MKPRASSSPPCVLSHRPAPSRTNTSDEFRALIKLEIEKWGKVIKDANGKTDRGNMSMTRFVAGMLSAGLMVLGAGVVSGQSYPNKTIRIVTSAVGGSGDITSRLVAQELSGPLGQPVIVDDRPTFAAIELVAKAPPDGYTVLESGSAIWITPLLQDNVPWDPVRDFSPITQVERSPNILVVHPSLPVKSVKELIALAKARPGERNYSSSAAGRSSHLSGELFKAMAGVNIVWVPYKARALPRQPSL